ncbi:amidase signature domain-containing protein [Ochromonadaceae sp. CCMP2298]|nr:amidase signature domain-containing protein [Ochromonadaceae sp. CCMP2298]
MDTPITGQKFKLGTPGYDKTALEAPVATSTLLQVLSFLLTRMPFSPALRRALINKNNIADLRELASQIQIPPLTFPMMRVSLKEYQELTTPDEQSKAKQILITGFGTDPLPSSDFPRTISSYHAHYAAGGVPSQVLRKTINTVRAWEAQGFKIFSSILESEVLAEAEASDERWRRGEPLSMFDGVPVAFKDMMDVKGHIIYDGKNPSPDHADEWVHSSQDSLMVSRLRALGAVVLGMTITVEGGVSPLGFNAHFQGPVSAYSFDRYSGGSSAGSAVAVATGIVPMAIGYDGGGSVRIPASMSGVHGLATTFGRIPFHNHSDSTMIKAGPIAASAEDVALTMAAIAQNAPGTFYTDLYDGGINGPPPPHMARFSDIEDLSDVRIGIYPEWFADSEPAIKTRCAEVVEFLKSRGATVVEVQIPHLRIMALAHTFRISTEFALGWDLHFYKHAASMEPGGRVVVGVGSTVTAIEALAADKVRAWGSQYVRELFATHNLHAIVNPTMPVEVPPLTKEAKVAGESNTALSVKIMRYIFIANLLGLPGYSVPVGYAEAKAGTATPAKAGSQEAPLMLPVGFHFLGRHWEEHKLMRLAHAVEKGFTRTLPQTQPMFFHDPFA